MEIDQAVPGLRFASKVRPISLAGCEKRVQFPFPASTVAYMFVVKHQCTVKRSGTLFCQLIPATGIP